MVLSKTAKKIFLEGRFAWGRYVLSLPLRGKLQGISKPSIGKPRNTENRGKKNYCDYLEQGL